MTKPSLRIAREKAGLVVVDIQERLLLAMFEKERMAQNAARLARGAAVLNVPVVATEQYRKGLGATVPEVALAIAGFAPMEKLQLQRLRCPGVCGGAQGQGSLRCHPVRHRGPRLRDPDLPGPAGRWIPESSS